MADGAPIRWGIVGTANIARAQFLPGLRAAGGVPTVVGSRDGARAQSWAGEYGIGRGVGSYADVVEAPDVEAIYVALPNNLHAEWTIAALRAGKAVLCEKPLCVSVAEAETVLRAATESGSLLWEAFVFPFHAQIARLQELIADGSLGDIREIQSNFYFKLRNRINIRLSPEMYGGAVNDVGCYPVRLAELVFGGEAKAAATVSTWAPEGVDEETQAIMEFSDGRRLTFSCGILRPYDTFTRVLGTEGEVRLSNPFHPGLQDAMEIRHPGRDITEHPTGSEPSFTNAIKHIHAAVCGREEARHLATDDSLATARDLSLLHERMGDGPM